MERIFERVRQGKFVIVTDEERECEGDLMVAASKATRESLAFMLNNAKGFLCIALPASRLKQLGIPQMVQDNTDAFRTPFTVTVGAKTGKSGVSASDRLEVIKLLMNQCTKPEDVAKPGHVIPLAAKEKGLLERKGHTEASVDLARLSGLEPGAVISEILNAEGEACSAGELRTFSEKFGIPAVTIEEILEYRKTNEKLVALEAESLLPTPNGVFNIKAYRAEGDSNEHVALVKGDVAGKTILARVHSQCLTGEAFGSVRCDCREQLALSLKLINENEGVLVYLRQEGRGIGLLNKIKAYEIQDRGADTVEANKALGFEADERDYWIAAQILKDLGVGSVRLLTNNTEKIADLQRYGVNVEERVPLQADTTPYNARYLAAKKSKLGHLL